FSLGGRTHDPIKAAYGKEKFAVCAACHGSDGKGNHALGAPNLTDKIWLYGGSEDAVVESILQGRKGVMPPHKDFLGEAKAHVLAAYVYGLSAGQPAAAPPTPGAASKATSVTDKK
ncbi:MAG: c-type cytochrome, partial [Burkholderiaceae bacterium]